MDQPTITNFFSKRKRSSAVDNNKHNSKVLLLERQPSGYSNAIDTPLNCDKLEGGESETNHLHKPVPLLYSAKQLSSTKLLLCKAASPRPRPSSKNACSKKNVSRAKSTPNPHKGREKDKPRTQPDIRETFLNVKKCVRFELKGSLSPKKVKVAQDEVTNNVLDPRPRPPAEIGECSADNPRHVGLIETILDQKVTSVVNKIEESPVGLDLDLVEKDEIVCHVAKTSEPILMDIREPKVGLEGLCKFDPSDKPRPTENLERKHIKDFSNTSSLMSPSRSSVDPDHVQSASLKHDTKNVATVNARRDLGLMTPKRMTDTRKELSLNEIKSRVCHSAKLTELRQSLAKMIKSNEKLKDIDRRKKQWQAESPKLGQFKTIAVEVKSPMKDVCSSPKKSYSPSASPSKGPAYQRLSSLAAAGPPVLALPFKHRCLAEVFRCVDTIVALMYNRKEVVTFKKLKPAVQQMLRRNFGESHLGQIKRVFPTAFSFRQEKARSFAYSTKPDQFELTITPLIDSPITKEGSAGQSGSEAAVTMNPTCLLARRETFTKNLVDRVKNVHEEYLSSLHPPLMVPRDKLTRWHPEFDLNNVPEIEPDVLPQPPNVVHHSSAKDVLDHAKTLFSCNERMERALERVSQISASSSPSKTLPKPSENASPISNALKGIPKAILEKVRANQAARAIVAMSRTPAEERQQTQYSRLPELARIIRNIFVGDKKKVMMLESAVQKLENSYRERLSPAELEEHVRLLIKSVPGWLEIQNVRKTNFLKLSKDGDMSKVMKKLEELAAAEK